MVFTISDGSNVFGSKDIKFNMNVIQTTRFKHFRKDCGLVTIDKARKFIPHEVTHWNFGKKGPICLR